MKYTNLLKNLFPPGLSFSFSRNETKTKLLEALAVELERIDTRVNNLLDEADPRTANELLSEWEAMVGLPGKCFAGLDSSIQERRGAIVAKLLDTGLNTVAAIENLMVTYGTSGTVSNTGPHTVLVHFNESTQIIPFRAGQGRAGENLLFFGGTPIECLIRKIKPAHTEFTFTYEV